MGFVRIWSHRYSFEFRFLTRDQTEEGIIVGKGVTEGWVTDPFSKIGSESLIKMPKNGGFSAF